MGTQSVVDEYLVVDRFLHDFIPARALKSAFELHLIDYLLDNSFASRTQLEQVANTDRPGLEMLLVLLQQNSVIQDSNGQISLTDAFKTALNYRDLLEIKLDFAGLITADFHELFTTLLVNPTAFRQHAGLFKVFDYQRCQGNNQQDYEWTKRWVRVVSVLTRYEAPVCLQYYDFSRYRRMLDIGGNSGEFALQACKRLPDLRATVMDLPLVCEVGLEHILPEQERGRISFIKGDIRQDEVPQGYDLITFKSMLHDWPDDQVKSILDKACKALQPGGSIVIFERGPIQKHRQPFSFSSIPLLLFFRSYRPPRLYVEQLRLLGFESVVVQEVELDTPFYIVSATKPA